MPIYEEGEVIPSGIPQAQLDLNSKIMRIEWDKLIKELNNEV